MKGNFRSTETVIFGETSTLWGVTYREVEVMRTRWKVCAWGALAAITLYGAGTMEFASSAPPPDDFEFRTVDGRGNHETHPGWGAAGEALVRIVDPTGYGDGVETPSGAERPSARYISNIVCAQPDVEPGAKGPSNLFWLWGQFVDHDLDLTESLHNPDGSCVESFPIPVPAGDPFFDPAGDGDRVIPLCRSIHDVRTGTDPSNPRQQTNGITSFLDGSNVYGSDVHRADTLRAFDGTGRLLTSEDAELGELLPFNVFGLENAGLPGQDPASLFLAGDVRANENVALMAMHTLWMREHNRLARRLANLYPKSTGDELYESARAIVAAEMQVITYGEFLPILLGPDAIGVYSGYDPSVRPDIANAFSTIAYRFGHSMLTDDLQRLDSDLRSIEAGPIALADAFFSPEAFMIGGGVEPLLRGAAFQRANDLDPFVVDAVRNFLFGPPGAGGFDLASLNIQRGRDHGHPSYNDVRAAYGLAPKGSLVSISTNADVRDRLLAAYDEVEQVDAWVGGLAEAPVNGGLLGETFAAIVRDQFVRLRDGDRLWHEHYLPERFLEKIRRQTLARVMRRNTGIDVELHDQVLLVP